MKRYENYQTVNQNGIEQLPGHWSMRKFNGISYMKGRIGWQNLRASEFIDDSPYYLITGMNFKNGSIDWNEVYNITEERYLEAPEIQLKENDVLMTKDGTIGKLLYIDNLPGPTSLNSHLLVFRPLSNQYYPKYLYYQLQSTPFLHHIELTKTGTTFYGITQEAVGEYKFILPPHNEQVCIGKYLDTKTLQINKLITNKKKLIEFLKEERTGLINEVVTRGINPNVKLKTSGIDWLGKIPEHWELRKLSRSFSTISSGTTPNTGNEGYYNNGTIPWVNTGNLNDGYLIQTTKCITPLAIKDHSTLKMYPKDTLLIAMYGATVGKVGILTFEACTNQACCAISNSPFFQVEFCYYWFIANRNNIIDLSYGGGQPNISQEIVRFLKIPCPPINEQSEIVEFIKEETSKIDYTISRIEKEIELMQEYRTALISEVVTGQVKVIE